MTDNETGWEQQLYLTHRSDLSLFTTLVTAYQHALLHPEDPSVLASVARLKGMTKTDLKDFSADFLVRCYGEALNRLLPHTARPDPDWFAAITNPTTRALLHGIADDLRKSVSWGIALDLRTQREKLLAALGEVMALVNAPPPPDYQWEFVSGRFRYGTRWFPLTGQKLSLLKAFVKARCNTLTNEQVNSACKVPGENREHRLVFDLNQALRRLWKISNNLIASTGDKSYIFKPPLFSEIGND